MEPPWILFGPSFGDLGFMASSAVSEHSVPPPE